MRASLVIPVIFGILFFSTLFSAQNVYGPHYTSFDRLIYDFQGLGVYLSLNLSQGIANQNKKAPFEVCVHLDKVTDSTIPTEIVALSLTSCQPITVVGPSNEKNFVLVEVFIPTGPLSSSSQRADFFGSYEIVNPGGKPMAGETIIDVKGVEIEPAGPVCVPPTCENNCNNHGTCVADDTCVCEKGWDSDELCSVPDCESNEDCSDANQCTIDVCHDNQCVSAEIPGCDPNDRCTSNEECSSPDECTVGFCDSIGNCQSVPIPGCTVCVPSGDEVCDGIDNDCDGAVDEDFTDLGAACTVGEGACMRTGTVVCDTSGGSTCNASPSDPSSEDSELTCTDGIDNDCDGFTDCDDESCINADIGVTCSLPVCESNSDCDDNIFCNGIESCIDGVCSPSSGNPCTGPDGDTNCSESCDEGAGSCTANDPAGSVCAGGVCDEAGVCQSTCVPESEVCDLRDNDCDGQVDEDVHDSINTPTSAIHLGRTCADENAGFLCPSTSFSHFSTQTGNTGKFFRVTAEECSDCFADLKMRFDLTVPTGINYDLFVFDSAGTTLLGSSRTTGTEQVIVRIGDSIESNDTTELLVEVRYVSGLSCKDWTLNLFGMR